MWDIRNVTKWYNADFRVTFYENGKGRLTLQSTVNRKRVHIVLSEEQLTQLKKDTENELKPDDPSV